MTHKTFFTRKSFVSNFNFRVWKIEKCKTKSDFLKTLDIISLPELDNPKIEMEVIDGAAFINMNRPKNSYGAKTYCPKTYGEYCKTEIANKLRYVTEGLIRDES